MAGPNLQQYIQTLRFLLHDPNAKNWTDQQLITNCINLARDRIISDLSSPQAIVQIPLVQGQEAYSFNTILSAVQAKGLPARAIQSILGVNFVQAVNLLIPLTPMPWSSINDIYRASPIQSLPESFSVPDIGGPLSNLYIEPAPSNGTWTAEVRCVWLPVPLVNNTDTEQAISSPLADTLVPYLAAKFAWSFNNDEDTADKMEQKYLRELAALAANMPPFVAIPYSSVY